MILKMGHRKTWNLMTIWNIWPNRVNFEFFHQSKKVFIRSRVSLVIKLNKIFTWSTRAAWRAWCAHIRINGPWNKMLSTCWIHAKITDFGICIESRAFIESTRLWDSIGVGFDVQIIGVRLNGLHFGRSILAFGASIFWLLKFPILTIYKDRVQKKEIQRFNKKRRLFKIGNRLSVKMRGLLFSKTPFLA